jgi:hypothetical protein
MLASGSCISITKVAITHGCKDEEGNKLTWDIHQVADTGCYLIRTKPLWVGYSEQTAETREVKFAKSHSYLRPN